MTNPADGTPLTRRQLRELAEATQAPAAPTSPSGAPPPVQPPAASVLPPTVTPTRTSAAPSRRETIARPQQAPAVAQPLTRSAGPISSGAQAHSRQAPVAGEPAAARPRRSSTDLPERGVPAGAGTGRVAAGAPGGPAQQTPSRVEQARSQQPAAAAPPAVSRRSLREQSEPIAAVIVPPSQTGKVRTINETGELSDLRAVGDTPPIALPPRSAQPAPAAPAPVRRSSVGAQPQTEFPAAGRPGTVPPAQMPTRTPTTPESAQPAWQSGVPVESPWAAVLGGAEATPVLSPAQPTPFASDLAATQVGDLPAIAPVEDLRPDELPAWDAITAGAPRTAAKDDEPELPEEFAEEPEYLEPNHKYTWLHYLILIAVAFVLGLIIWKVGLENRSAEGLPGQSGQTSATAHLGSSLIEESL